MCFWRDNIDLPHIYRENDACPLNLCSGMWNNNVLYEMPYVLQKFADQCHSLFTVYCLIVVKTQVKNEDTPANKIRTDASQY